MTQQITIPDLTLSTVIPLNSLIPFENLQNNETQATTLSTILSNVLPSNKVYINNVLSGTYPAINFVAGSNTTITGVNNSNYYTLTINSTIPNPLTITNVGGGINTYKDFTSTYNFKTLIAGSNISITPDVDTITISTINSGEVNTVSTVGSGISLFKEKSASDLVFKSIVAGTNISLDTSNPNQITINSTGGSSNATGQNVGIGTGRFYINNVSSVLRFKTIKAGSNIIVSDSASEITISSIGGTEGTTISNTNDIGSKVLNQSGQLKTIIPGDGIIINDAENSLTISTNSANAFSSVGTGISFYKGFNTALDRYELKTIKAQDGLIIEDLNANEVVIRGNVTATITSTNTTNTLISSQIGATTTLKVINFNNPLIGSISNNTQDLTINILNSSPLWNANRINSIPITSLISPLVPEQESTLVYRGAEYISGTPSNLVIKYLKNQSFGNIIPANNQVFKVTGDNTWGLATPADSTSPLINFLGYYITNRLYVSGSIIEDLTGIVAGTIYYLDSNSTISTTTSTVIIGIGLSTTTLWFKPYAI